MVGLSITVSREELEFGSIIVSTVDSVALTIVPFAAETLLELSDSVTLTAVSVEEGILELGEDSVSSLEAVS